MNGVEEWRAVYSFWFPPALDADLETHRRMFHRWFGGGPSTELPPFSPLVEAAKNGRLGHWLAQPLGRLSLVIVLDQFPRGLAESPQILSSRVSHTAEGKRGFLYHSGKKSGRGSRQLVAHVVVAKYADQYRRSVARIEPFQFPL